MSTKYDILLPDNNGSFVFTKHPVKREIFDDCDCCEELPCIDPINCAFGMPPNCFQRADGPGTGTYSPKNLYVDSSGWVDDNCDCDNLNHTFKLYLQGPSSGIVIASRPLSWSYDDGINSLSIAAPIVSTFGPPNDIPGPWVLEIDSPGIGTISNPQINPNNFFRAKYTCPGDAFRGCGSAVFAYVGTIPEFGQPSQPPGCLQFPQTLVVRTDEDDPCNCVCNTMSVPAPLVLYLNSDGGDGIPLINLPFFQAKGQGFAWVLTSSVGIFPGLSIVCCNGKLYFTDYVERWCELTGSGCSWSGSFTIHCLASATVHYTITCDPI